MSGRFGLDEVRATTVIAGEQITYTIIVTNNGPSTAQSVDVKDQLPAGVSLASATVTRSGSGNALCGGTVCQVGDMAINEVVTVTVVGNVDSTVADGTVVNNTATVFSDSPDPVSANNTNSAATTVSASADLSVAKTVSPNPAVPGETVTYQIVVSNAGPSAAADVKITDTIPTELTGVTVSPSQGTCTVGGNCSLGTIPAGGSASVTIVGTVNPAVTAGFTNNVTVGSPTTDPMGGNNTATAPSTVAPNADLALDIVSTPTTNGGTTATVTVTVQNNGPSNAVGTAVTVTLPASTTVNDISSQLPSGWTAVDNGNGTVTITTTNVLTSGQVVNLPIVVNVDPAVEPGTSLPFTGTTTSATADSTPNNNSGTTDTSVVGLADLALTKTGPTTVVAGEQITYTIIVTNNGPSTAQSVDIKDALPSGIDLASATVTRSSTGNTLCGGTVCQVGDMALNEVVTITVVGNVGSGVANGTLVTNTATVFSDTPDPVTSNNSDTAQTTVNALALLTVSKHDLVDPVGLGELLAYEIVVTNTGSSDATNVVITDTLDSNTAYQSNTDSCVEGPAGTLVCSLGTVATGTVSRFLVTVLTADDVLSGTVATNAITLTTDTPLAGGSVTTASENTTIVQKFGPPADLSIAKSAAGTVIAGQQLTYTIQVTNNGTAGDRCGSSGCPAQRYQLCLGHGQQWRRLQRRRLL